MKMLIGLGNPGDQYRDTRHNVGFMVIDALARHLGTDVGKKESRALTGTALYHGEKLLLVKPQTYMNNSGEAVWGLIHYYRNQIDDFLVIYDDMDLPVGAMRFKQKGSAGGHNGMKSLIQHLHSETFDRLKLGIDRRGTVVQHVLSTFSKEDKATMDDVIETCVPACLYWAEHGIIDTMNRYNSKK